MNKRLVILSVIILVALTGLTCLGYHSIQMWAQGLEGARLGEFAEVAEQTRQDVKRKLDEFIQREQQRPYTDYQYYYVPESVASTQQSLQTGLLLRSPLGSTMDNDLAYGNFQIEPDGSIVTPYYRQDQSTPVDDLAHKANAYLENVRRNLLPALSSSSGTFTLPPRRSEIIEPTARLKTSSEETKATPKSRKLGELGDVAARYQDKKGRVAKEYAIESLQKRPQEEQVITQQRSLVASNIAQMEAPGKDSDREQVLADRLEPIPAARSSDVMREQIQSEGGTQGEQRDKQRQTIGVLDRAQAADQNLGKQQAPAQQQSESEMVQIRIEPFVPIIVPGGKAEKSIFGGQVFLMRHVQIEDKHILQGFQLNEQQLIEEVRKSASRFMREGMTFELVGVGADDSAAELAKGDVAYTAILDFGFGDLVLNLKEIDPAWIIQQTDNIRLWYFGIIAVVFLAVALGLASLWHNVRAQVTLAQKKDDFISAVSHELRTPLTSIRMYSEMLEKNWVKSKEKLAEYYRNMRQESERLSRLIENVLDFSRIQKGRKKYTFTVGDINNSIAEVVEMIRPYAAQNGFSIKTGLAQFSPIAFDKDAVTQIVVNLLDNAIKYARNAQDKTINIRTKKEGRFVLIEVEDHGPGVPHRQRRKIFEQFYRCGTEATRETTGTGLGLALVKKFAEAHNGFVEIISAKPTGIVFRVALAAQAEAIRSTG